MKKVDFFKIKTYSLGKRKSKVHMQNLAKVPKKGGTFGDFYQGLPQILAVNSLKAVVDAICKAHRSGKMVIFMLGAHVIKCGLSPLIIDLMKRGVIKAVALNGAGIIHDLELAMAGQTSEEVAEGLQDGSFGMSKDTADFINFTVSKKCAEGQTGIGEALGEEIARKKLRYKSLSILGWGHRLQIPVTVHVAIGTDIVHQHPSANGAAIGNGTMEDFKRFVSVVAELGQGGVVLNFGSAVVLPEVFLKAINVARNLGFKVKGFTCANFDMYTHYRPTQNILLRPTQKGMGKGFNILGHHEIMLPLLYRAIIEGVT